MRASASRAGDADDHRDAPALVAAFERLAHHVHVADALEAVVRAAARQVYQFFNNINPLGIDEMRHPKFLRERFALRIQVHAHDHVRARQPRALHHVQADAAQAEHHHVRARLDLRRVF